MPRLPRATPGFFALWLVAGCVEPLRAPRSPLAPPQMSADSVVLEIFFVRFPSGEDQTVAALWADRKSNV